MSSKYTLDSLSQREIRILDRLAQKVANSSCARKLSEQEVQAILSAIRQQSQAVPWVN